MPMRIRRASFTSVLVGSSSLATAAALAASLALAPATSASASPGPGAAPAPSAGTGGTGGTGAGGLRLEPRPQFDDVFGDTAGYQRTIDRFIGLTTVMRRVSDDFSRAVQEALAEVGKDQREDKDKDRARGGCAPQVARSYLRAHGLGQEYLRIGRELNRRHEQVRELDRLGDTASLTADYRDKVRQVMKSYEALLVDYREMKATFHEQLTDELRFAGCEPGQILAQAGVVQKEETEALALPTAPGPVPDEPRKAAGAEQANLLERSPAPILFYVDNSRCRRAHRVFLDGKQVGEVLGSARGVFHSTVGPHEICLLDVPGQPAGTKVAAIGLPPPLAAPPAAPAPAAAAQPGQDKDKDKGGGPCDPGTVRRGYLHDGWTIALRCE